MFRKNQAVTGFGIGNFINATTGATVTTGTPTCKRTLDGTAGACANAAAYDATGLTWKIDLAAGDMNGDMVALSFTLTDCLPINYTIRTTTLVVDANGLADANMVKAGPTGSGATQTARDLGAQLDTTVSSRSTLTAQQVWEYATRTLSSFGTLAADMWAVATRTLTTVADSSGVTTLLARIIGTLAAGTHNPQSGDAYARLGAPAGASVSADIADLPTNAELATALAGADDAVLAAIALLHNLSSAGAQAAAAAALTTYMAAKSGDVPSATTIKTMLEADGSKLDHLWEMTEDDGGTRRLTAFALAEAPTGGSADLSAITDALAELAETLDAIKGAGWADETLVAIDTLLGAIKAKTDLLTNASATPVVTPVVGSKQALTIGTTFTTTVTGLTISAGWQKVLYTLKFDVGADDDEAILQLAVSNPAAALIDGVLYVEAAAAATAQRTLGSLTVSQAAGEVTITLGATLLAALTQHGDVVWDIKEIATTGQYIRGTGTADVQWSVTHTTS